MEIVELVLYRDNLQMDFVVGAQEIKTDAKLTLDHLKKIEHITNDTCKELEKFTVKAILEIDKVTYYSGGYLKRADKVKLIQIQDFDKNNLLNKSIDI